MAWWTACRSTLGSEHAIPRPLKQSTRTSLLCHQAGPWILLFNTHNYCQLSAWSQGTSIHHYPGGNSYMPKEVQHTLAETWGICLEVDAKFVIPKRAKYNIWLAWIHDIRAIILDSRFIMLSHVAGNSSNSWFMRALNWERDGIWFTITASRHIAIIVMFWRTRIFVVANLSEGP